jgi:hypothetical protein
MENETLDPHGFPIEMDRPVVFEENSLDPHTELSITEHASDLGLPGEGFYNVPSIHGGVIYDPQTQFEQIRQAVQQRAAEGFRYPNFPTVEAAEEAAKARSEYFNQVKAEQLKQAIQQQREKLMLELVKRYGQ